MYGTVSKSYTEFVESMNNYSGDDVMVTSRVHIADHFAKPIRKSNGLNMDSAMK